MKPLDVSFFKGLALYISEQLSELNLRMALQGIEVVRKDYASIISGMPEFSHFAVANIKEMSCAFHAGKKLVSVATDRLLGGSGVLVDGDQDHFTFSQQFLFKSMVDWMIVYFEQKELDLEVHRILHHSRSMHLFFHDEAVACVSVKIKLNQNIATTLQFICPNYGVKDA